MKPVKMALTLLEELEPRYVLSPPAVYIPSVNLSDPSVNGAEHACPGLQHADNNPNQDVQEYRHGCACEVTVSPPPSTQPPPTTTPPPSTPPPS